MVGGIVGAGLLRVGIVEAGPGSGMLDTVCSSLLLLLLCTLVQRPCHQLSNQGGMIIAHSGSFQYRADYEGDRAPHRVVKVGPEHMC